MYNNLVGFNDSIIDFMCIDNGVFEYTFKRCLDGFEKLGWFFLNGQAVGHPYIIPKVFILSSFWIEVTIV
jgi:hypothetical protein